VKALIVVDLQVDFCEGGLLGLRGGNRVAHDTRKFLRSHGEDYDLRIATYDWHIDPGSHWSEDPDFIDSWPRHCEAGTAGAELHLAIRDFLFEYRIYKGQYSAAYSGFEGTTSASGHVEEVSLDDLLKRQEITEVDLVGLAFDKCVADTAIGSVQRGYKTRILTKMTAAVKGDKKSVMDTAAFLRAGGVEIVV
jgi:nicotinamidase/pyrazinamidase